MDSESQNIKSTNFTIDLDPSEEQATSMLSPPKRAGYINKNTSGSGQDIGLGLLGNQNKSRKNSDSRSNEFQLGSNAFDLSQHDEQTSRQSMDDDILSKMKQFTSKRETTSSPADDDGPAFSLDDFQQDSPSARQSKTHDKVSIHSRRSQPQAADEDDDDDDDDDERHYSRRNHSSHGADEDDDDDDDDDIQHQHSSSYQQSSSNFGYQSQPKTSFKSLKERKEELLYSFDRLRRRGVPIPKHYSMSSSIEEMEYEYNRIAKDREMDASVRFQQKALMAVVSGIEWLNEKFDPLDLKLNGWSESVHTNLDDYSDIFEELHEKYKDRAKISPELKLALMVPFSGLMYHFTNVAFQSSMPDYQSILKKNPELMKQMQEATMDHFATQDGPVGQYANTMRNMTSSAPPQRQPSGPGGIVPPPMGFGMNNSTPRRQSPGPMRQDIGTVNIPPPQGVEDILNELGLDSNGPNKPPTGEEDIISINASSSNVNGKGKTKRGRPRKMNTSSQSFSLT